MIYYYIILYYTILWYIILYYTILSYTILYCIIHLVYYIILYYSILYCILLYYIILYCANGPTRNQRTDRPIEIWQNSKIPIGLSVRWALSVRSRLCERTDKVQRTDRPIEIWQNSKISIGLSVRWALSVRSRLWRLSVRWWATKLKLSSIRTCWWDGTSAGSRLKHMLFSLKP